LLFAKVDLPVMEMETVLLYQFQFSVLLDSTVMETETVFQVQPHFHLSVHQDKQVTELETAYQFQ
jgi:hypothetical protein